MLSSSKVGRCAGDWRQQASMSSRSAGGQPEASSLVRARVWVWVRAGVGVGVRVRVRVRG